ncbi:MAG: serine hydrolase [Selenomonadaceae bacterium]|nr:serine hydrolase [Selenomonadaceae bacterium]
MVAGAGVIVYRNGAEVYADFFGVRSLKKNKPVTRATRFRAASVSKLFTIFTIMQLVERGRINLDADAGEYLGFKTGASVRDLASHTSGLRDGKIYSIPPNFSVEEFFKPDGKFFENGAHFGDRNFCYSNLNYGLLGTIIEAVTGERFDIYQRENILSQLDIRADYVVGNLGAGEFENLGAVYLNGKATDEFDVQPKRDTVALQNPYAENFNGVCSLKNYRAGTNATIFSPQGGLRISFEELTHALEMLMGGGKFRGRQILSAESVAEIFKSHWIYDGANGDTCGGEMLNYGLGSYVIDGGFAGHAGEAFGMLSGIFFKGTSGFVYMMNGEDFALENALRNFARGLAE